MGTGNSDWYDQKKLTDTEHGNISYYAVLSKTRIQKQQDMAVTADPKALQRQRTAEATVDQPLAQPHCW